MNSAPNPPLSSVAGFRAKLLVAMMLVVGGITALALTVALRRAAQAAESELRRDFRNSLGSLQEIENIRRALLVDRCRALARKPRIHAALEANAPELLYPSARDGLRDLMLSSGTAAEPVDPAIQALRVQFYRFLDAEGKVLPTGGAEDAGVLSAAEEQDLALPALPVAPQTGFLWRGAAGPGQAVAEFIAMPIISTESSDVISAIVLGFKPVEVRTLERAGEMKSGLWLDGELHLPGLADSSLAALAEKLAPAVETTGTDEHRLDLEIAGVDHLVFSKILNPDSAYPPVFQVCVYPLTELAATQSRLFREILAAGAVLMLGGLMGSQYFSRRLARPVEELAESRQQLQRTLDELREAERELVQAEKMAALGNLTNGMMHEINNPLNFALTALFVLENSSNELPKDQREDFADLIIDIKEGLNRIRAIVEDLRDFSAPRLSTIANEPIPVCELVRDTLRLLASRIKETPVQIEEEIPEDLTVCGDRNQLTLVFLNIIRNAFDAHRERAAEVTGPGHLRIAARAHHGQVEVAIKDDAGGIPADQLSQVFDPFFTTKPPDQGMGMGLSTSYRIVSAHEGNLAVESEVGRGTTFTLRLPGSAAPSVPSAPARPLLPV